MAFEGVCEAELAREHARWEAVGAGVADLAELVRRSCAASAFCRSRPQADRLIPRISEALDDQVDAVAWRVIEAAARRRIPTT